MEECKTESVLRESWTAAESICHSYNRSKFFKQEGAQPEVKPKTQAKKVPKKATSVKAAELREKFTSKTATSRPARR